MKLSVLRQLGQVVYLMMHFWTIRELQFLSSQCPQHNPKAGADKNNLSRAVREHLDCPGSCSHHRKTITSPLHTVAQQLGVKMKKATVCRGFLP